MRVFFSAGEASGDRYAAALASEIRGRASGWKLEGIGGRNFRSVADSITIDSSSWGAIGIVQSLRVASRVLRGYTVAKRALQAGQPGLCIPIDFGFMNVKLARWARSNGWKILYFIPPGSWRKDRQGADIPLVSDVIVTPFPWSAEILRSMGADARWLGHPLKQLVAASGMSVERSANVIGILPGSRRHEVALNLPLIAAAVSRRTERVEIALAPSLDPGWVAELWREHSNAPASVVMDDTYGVLKRARAAVVCSGTATLEAALCHCPCIVVYKLSRMMALEAAIVRPKFQYVSLPNILLGRSVLPELLHKGATTAAIASELGRIIQDGPVRQAQVDAFEELDDVLGSPTAIRDTIDVAFEMMGA